MVLSTIFECTQGSARTHFLWYPDISWRDFGICFCSRDKAGNWKQQQPEHFKSHVGLLYVWSQWLVEFAFMSVDHYCIPDRVHLFCLPSTCATPCTLPSPFLPSTALLTPQLLEAYEQHFAQTIFLRVLPVFVSIEPAKSYPSQAEMGHANGWLLIPNDFHVWILAQQK